MASTDLMGTLNGNTFALHFVGGSGVNAADLGELLRYSATIARRQGVALEVLGLEPGSLTVRLCARLIKELKNAPIATTTAAVTVLAPLLSAFTPTPDPAPVAKVAIKMVEEGSVEKIEIVTQGKSHVVMDMPRVASFRSQGRFREEYAIKTDRYSQPEEVRLMVQAASDGTLIGEVFEVASRPYFRPSGFNYLVPIKLVHPNVWLEAGQRYEVEGVVTTKHGQPDVIQISGVRRL